MGVLLNYVSVPVRLSYITDVCTSTSLFSHASSSCMRRLRDVTTKVFCHAWTTATLSLLADLLASTLEDL